MSYQRKIALKNSSVSFISQVIAIIFQFINRTVFINYLGFELLGISSTLTSVLSTLSLAELGFSAMIVFRLYKPLHEKDYPVVNDLMNIFKTVYVCLGIFFVIATAALCPFVGIILNGVNIDKDIYIIFILMGINIAFTYFMAHKRVVFYADQQDYISKMIDSSINVVFSVLKIFVIVKTSNFIIYLVLTIIQNIVTNSMISIIGKRKYPFLHHSRLNKGLFGSIIGDIKNVFSAKIAGYIYASTDNLVISAFINTISVGRFVNYTIVTANIKLLVNSIVNPIAPFIGNHLVTENNDQSKVKMLNLITHVRFIIAMIVIVPICVLLQDFVIEWTGTEYAFSQGVVYLLCIDLFIHIVHSSCCDYINGAGLFKQERNIEIIGAAINIIFSIALVKELGVIGVLLGTVISQSVFWLGRSIIVFKLCFEYNWEWFKNYWMKNVTFISSFIVAVVMSTIIYDKLLTSIFIVKFILGGLVTEAIVVLVYVFVSFRNEEFKKLVELISKK